MIKVNLAGVNPKKPAIALAGASMKTSAPWTVTPIILILIILGSAAVGYSWYSSLTGQVANLESKIQQELAEKVRLDAVIKQGEIYEARKKMLERRIKIIEGLQRNQISPVVALDVLSEAVDRTKYVWLSNVDQNNTVFSMNGLGTSLLAIADFYSNLERTGYFRNIDIANAQDSSGNYTFSLKCEFAPPSSVAAVTSAVRTGAN